MIQFLLGVPGRLKVLTDRITSTRATAMDTMLSTAQWTNARAAYLDALANGVAKSRAEVFTASGTFTWRTGVDLVWISGCGGGGSGAGFNSTSSKGGGGGGGGGGVWKFPVYRNGATTTAVTIPSAAAAVGNNTNGNAGGTVTFGAFLSLLGGAGGLTDASNYGAGGQGGTAFGGAGGAAASGAGNPGTSVLAYGYLLPGAGGGNGFLTSSVGGYAGLYTGGAARGGGASWFGNGGTTGAAGTLGGGGGGSGTSGVNSGAGGAGYLIVEYVS